MTQRTFLDIGFTQSGRREVVAGFCGGRISSDGGLPLLRQVEKRLNLAGKLAACAREWRNPAMVEHDLRQLFAQRIFAIACGYEGSRSERTFAAHRVAKEQRPPNTARRLAKRACPLRSIASQGALFQLCAAKPGKQLASPATLSRFENKAIGRRELLEMQGAFVQTFLNAHKQPPEEIILDFDSSDIELHGNQEKKSFHGTLISTATFHSTSTAEITCCAPGCARPTSTTPKAA